MTDDERQERLAELRRWLEELCAELAAETARYWPELREECTEKWTVAAATVWLHISKLAEEKLDDKLARKWPSPDDLRRYVKKAIRNAWMDARREPSRRKKWGDKLLAQESKNPGTLKKESVTDPPYSEHLQSELLKQKAEITNRHLEPCLRRLNDRDRRVLIAVKRDGEALEEVTRREVPGYDAMTKEDQKRAYDKIKKALSRACPRVRECMVERGVKYGDLS